MWRVTWLFAGMVCGALGLLAAQSYHVVNTKDGLKVVAKRQSSLADTYVDVRSWGLAEWSKHPDLMWTLSQNNQQDVFAAPAIEEGVQSAWQSLERR